MRYYQCRLIEHIGHRETVAWIEERGAIIGARIEVQDFPGAPFFEVLEVYHPAFDSDALRTKQKADRNAFGSILGARG